MTLTDMLVQVLKNEASRRKDNQEDLLQKAEAFDLLIKRGVITPERYGVAPISPLPIRSSLKSN